MGVESPARRHLRAVLVSGNAFFEASSARLANTCWGMARRFQAGGKLVVVGRRESDLSDASHNAVEFVHPVLVGKRALPAIALRQPRHRQVLAGSEDILMEIGPGRLRVDGEEFEVRGEDPLVGQEVVETAYHELWELVHVFFEHQVMLGSKSEICVTCGDVALQAGVISVERGRARVRTAEGEREVDVGLVEPVRLGDVVLVHGGVALERLPEIDAFSREFYPFLGEETHDVRSVLAEVAAGVRGKWEEVAELRRAVAWELIGAAAAAVAARVRSGGRLLCFGNGGSATDSADLAGDLLDLGVPALDLAGEPAVITALANDLGFGEVFARQLIALGRPGDVAVGITTSGCSGNVLRGLEQARASGMLTIAMSGYGGAELSARPDLDHLLTVASTHVPRIQEVQATMCHALVREIEGRL